jgi:hypothetical protein
MKLRSQKLFYAFVSLLIFQTCQTQMAQNTNQKDTGVSSQVQTLPSQQSDILERTGKYVEQGIHREELLSAVATWEKDRKIILISEAKNNFLREYLISEYFAFETKGMGQEVLASANLTKEQIKIKGTNLELIPDYLDEITFKEKVVPFFAVMQFKTNLHYGTTQPVPNQYGRINVTSVPENSEIYIDGSFREYSNKEFVALTGDHEVTVKRSGFPDCQHKVTVNSGRKSDVRCEFK